MSERVDAEDVIQAVVIADSFNFRFLPITVEQPRALLPLAPFFLLLSASLPSLPCFPLSLHSLLTSIPSLSCSPPLHSLPYLCCVSCKHVYVLDVGMCLDCEARRGCVGGDSVCVAVVGREGELGLHSGTLVVAGEAGYLAGAPA